MAAMQVRLERKALATPESRSICFIACGPAHIDDLAAATSLHHPTFSTDKILTHLLVGEQVTKEGSFSSSPSLTGRLMDILDIPTA